MNDQVQPIEIDDAKQTIYEISQYRNTLCNAGKRLSMVVSDYPLERQRQNSLPLLEHHNLNRNLIFIYVLKKISELQMDVNMAKVILNQMDENQFTENSQNRILSNVLEGLLLTEQISSSEPQQPGYSFSGVSKQFKQYLGFENQVEIKQQNSIDGIEEIHCQICMCDYAPNETVRIEGCIHEFCKLCIGLYLENLIMSSQVTNIKCPNQNCDQQFLDKQIDQTIDQALFQKMLKFRNIKILMEDDEVRFCPRPGCEKHVIRKFKNEKQIVCECGQSICFDCGIQTHNGSCEAAIDNNFRLAMKQYVIQNCPSCKSPIQKNDGCNHMTCHTCKYEFCWLCRSKYSYNHFNSYNILGCPGSEFIVIIQDMTYSNRAPFTYPKFYRFLAILILIIVGTPLAAIGAAIGLVGILLFLPLFIYHQNIDCYFNNCFYQFIINFFLVIISIALTPITIALICLAIALSPLIGLGYLIFFLCICYQQNDD